MPRYTMRKQILAVGGDYDVLDESGEVAFEVDGKVRFASTFVIKDRDGNEVAAGREKLLSLDTGVHLQRAGQPLAVVRKVFVMPAKLFSGVEKIAFVVDVTGGATLEAHGAFYEDDYALRRGTEQVATVKQLRTGTRESYEIVVAPGEDDALVLAIATAIVKLVPAPSVGEP